MVAARDLWVKTLAQAARTLTREQYTYDSNTYLLYLEL